MSQDVFGRNIEPAVTGGAVALAEAAIVQVGNADAGLVQDYTIDYAMETELVQQLGKTAVFWVPGRPQGTFAVSRIVGPGGFFAGWSGGNCGAISSATVSLNGGSCDFHTSGKLSYSNGIFNRLGSSGAVGQLTVRESCQITFSKLSN